MSGAGWAKSNGEYGSTDDVYITYSFYETGSTFSYLSAHLIEHSQLTSLTESGRGSVVDALNQIEKFTI